MRITIVFFIVCMLCITGCGNHAGEDGESASESSITSSESPDDILTREIEDTLQEYSKKAVVGDKNDDGSINVTVEAPDFGKIMYHLYSAENCKPGEFDTAVKTSDDLKEYAFTVQNADDQSILEGLRSQIEFDAIAQAIDQGEFYEGDLGK